MNGDHRLSWRPLRPDVGYSRLAWCRSNQGHDTPSSGLLSSAYYGSGQADIVKRHGMWRIPGSVLPWLASGEGECIEWGVGSVASTCICSISDLQLYLALLHVLTLSSWCLCNSYRSRTPSERGFLFIELRGEYLHLPLRFQPGNPYLLGYSSTVST